MKYTLLLSLFLVTKCFAQDEIKLKNVSDTILQQNRTLEMPNPFDATKALLKLFPGRYYNLSKDKYINDLISWECETCVAKAYQDVNEDGAPPFPFKDGVATRLINIMSYSDSSGTKYKVISFNHSDYDADGAQTSRFTGGLLGLAKFVLINDKWVLKFFQPAIAAYGAFSQCPTPTALLIGQDQYAFMLKHSNGGGGGPFDGTFFLIAGANGAYQQVLAAYGIERTEGGEGEGSVWTGEYSVPPSDKKFFRDIVVTIKGSYRSTDTENLPAEVVALIKGKKQGKFMVEQRFVYKGVSKGYVLQSPAKASLVN